MLVASGVLREDTVGFKSSRAHMIYKRFFGFDRQIIRVLIYSLQLQIDHRHFVFMPQQTIHY